MKRLEALALAALLLAGCSGADDTPATAPISTTAPTSASPTPAPEPSPTPSEATVEQYASLVAESAPAIREQIEQMSACLPSEYDKPPCSAHLLSLGINGETLALALEAAEKEGAPGYLGPPPAEVADLVAKTATAARKVSEAADALSKCVDGGGECTEERAAAFAAKVSIESRLDAWKPYGV